MLQDQELMRQYRLVRPIVFRLRRLYHIKLWQANDWEQEGLICLYCLLEAHPHLSDDIDQLRRYFKTKFSNYIKDCIRRQTSIKRRFNAMAYEEVSELAHLIPAKGMLVDDYVAFCDSLVQLKATLSEDERRQLEDLTFGGCFKGRKALFVRFSEWPQKKLYLLKKQVELRLNLLDYLSVIFLSKYLLNLSLCGKINQ